MHQTWLALVLSRKQVLQRQLPRAACPHAAPGATGVFSTAVCVQTSYGASVEPGNDRENLQATAPEPGLHQGQGNTFPAEIKPTEARFHPEALAVAVTWCQCPGTVPSPRIPIPHRSVTPLVGEQSISVEGTPSPKGDEANPRCHHPPRVPRGRACLLPFKPAGHYHSSVAGATAGEDPPSHLPAPRGAAPGLVLSVPQFKFKVLQKIASCFPFYRLFL